MSIFACDFPFSLKIIQDLAITSQKTYISKFFAILVFKELLQFILSAMYTNGPVSSQIYLHIYANLMVVKDGLHHFTSLIVMLNLSYK
jgi:hypothetical protein